jgi:hypothetical protein
VAATKPKSPTELTRIVKAILVSFVFTLLPVLIWIFGLNILMTYGLASIDTGPSQHIQVVYQAGVVCFILLSLVVYKTMEK